MSDSHVISALRAKRAELAGNVSEALKRLEILRDDLDAIDRALRVFDPSISPEKIRPVVKRRGAKLFRHGECTRAIFIVLRDALQPMTAREVEERLIVDYRLDVGTPAAKAKLKQVVRDALKRHADKTLAKSGIGTMATWSVKA